jgi:hypothetical protein
MKLIRTGQSHDESVSVAVREFYNEVNQADMALVLFFCSTDYNLKALAEEMKGLFGDALVVGCTTAGEIGPDGYGSKSVAGVSFSAEICQAVAGSIDDLKRFEIASGEAMGRRLLSSLNAKDGEVDENNSFGFLLIDGLSQREEQVARACQNALGKISVVGGSAGDGLSFRQTFVYTEGEFHSNAAALVLVTTSLPMKVFKTQHFVPTDQRLVITEADPARRVVKEINGFPAAQEYARVLGVDERDLNPKRFASFPVVVLIDGQNYVRSIQKINADRSITLFCAIEEGVVLRAARGVDMVENLERAFDGVRAAVGPPEVVLACDCILRKLEAMQSGKQDQIEEILLRNRVVGFHTYGEQYHGVHVNQTFTGMALGAPVAESDHV